MAKNQDSVLYSFRLNINNPEHLELHKFLRDLDPGEYKSRSNYIIEALRKQIFKVKDDVEMQGGYVTKAYVESIKKELSDEIEDVIKRELFNMVLAATSGINNGRIITSRDFSDDKPLRKSENDDETNQLLSNLNSRWT